MVSRSWWYVYWHCFCSAHNCRFVFTHTLTHTCNITNIAFSLQYFFSPLLLLYGIFNLDCSLMKTPLMFFFFFAIMYHINQESAIHNAWVNLKSMNWNKWQSKAYVWLLKNVCCKTSINSNLSLCSFVNATDLHKMLLK